jgi:hypothetical protein
MQRVEEAVGGLTVQMQLRKGVPMSHVMPGITRANMFGDVRAEQDHAMLDIAFHEWQNYLTLFESSDRFIVVGRRGTGKSALTYRLQRDWRERKIPTLVFSPKEEEVIGFRAVAGLFGDSVGLIRAGVKLAWRYTLLLEIGLLLAENYKLKAEVNRHEVLAAHLRTWVLKGDNPLERLRIVLRESLKGQETPEDRIGELPRILQLNKITEDIVQLLESSDKKFVILIDRLDEGYAPDTLGVGIVDGLIYGTDDVRSALGKSLSAIIFLRDNIFRAIQTADHDFSRNLEGQVLRLHWDAQELFYMVTKRIRTGLGIEKESDVKVWNSITSNELHGREGFKKCLRHTLYRPRDVILLMNTAFFNAQRHQRSTLIPDDFNSSAKQISVTRYDDLEKEYGAVFPGIRSFTQAFAHGLERFGITSARDKINNVIADPSLTSAALQHAKILGTPDEIIKVLYGIGFFGVLGESTGSFVFSHDGKQPDREFSDTSVLLVHPCYWAALSLRSEDLTEDVADEIFDEYEINISSESAETRQKKLGQLIQELKTIPFGIDGATDFEEWCKRVVEIAFAKELTNIELKPNGNATQRRDVVGTNAAVKGFWKRILKDYQTRQVVFEIKNYEHLGVDEYRQVSGYLGREYGNLAFILCRDPMRELVKGRDLEAFKEFYDKKNQVILKVSSQVLTSILSKLRSPQKTDVADQLLEKHLDNHIRLFANGQQEKYSRKPKSVS